MMRGYSAGKQERGKLQTDIGNVDLRVVFFILALLGNITI